MNDETRRARKAANESPVAWFAVLERARSERDYKRAAHALDELKRLGVTVTYRRAGKGADND